MLDGLPGGDNRGSLVEKHRGFYVLEYRDRGCTYYRQHFRHTGKRGYYILISLIGLYGSTGWLKSQLDGDLGEPGELVAPTFKHPPFSPSEKISEEKGLIVGPTTFH